ncbi:MAG: 50S ribosomal protein L23 [Alphaproteobacteria bacterium]|jgi:large subunit ribosomal protein L23|nr:50S ribosomal protein L23 [Alphaproteobacteria bacterium]MBT5389705.1 50S ribosomal protein L23 [Alphaproteobacteria bacterium]MBT5654097.1 50S ribosomal protein L23 [Alphaproteobacteria bacterium]
MTIKTKIRKEVTLSKERIYEILRKPSVTEKSTMVTEQNQYVFEISPKATKPEVKKAVEELFGVKVKAVNTLNRQGKVKRFRGKLGTKQNMKRAYVTLAEGSTLDLSTGL